MFPSFDIISEEDKNKKHLKSRNNKWITVDPLCGTKNFSRKSSGGIATTINMVINHKIVSVYRKRNNSGDFWLQTAVENVYRISEFETYEKLNRRLKTLNKQDLLIRGTFNKFPDNVQPMVKALVNDVLNHISLTAAVYH